MMHKLFALLFNHFALAGTMMLAAGAPSLTDAGAGGGSSADGGTSSGVDAPAADDLGYGDDTPTDDAATDDGGRLEDGVDEGTQDDATRPTDATKEEPELAEFKGAVAQRLRLLEKRAPGLAQDFQKDPKLKEEIAAVFRREAALREVFPTVAEARQMREHFPNGLQDVQALISDVQEVEALDRNLITRDRDGNYTGHAQIINKLFADDREATVALFKSLPREWARLDQESYNEVMGKVVGATFKQRQIPEFISDLVTQARELGSSQLTGSLENLLKWANGYIQDGKTNSSPEQERFANERKQFESQKSQRAQEDSQRFHQSFLAESKKLQVQTINAHPAVKKLMATKNITEAKKAQLIEQVRTQMASLLAKSPAFMRKLGPAYKSGNLQDTLTLQKAAWSQQWLLNRMVRGVFQKEIPALVSANREAANRRAGATAVRTPAKPGVKAESTAPVQIQGRWYRNGGKGAPYTTAEVLAGKHLAS